MTHTRMRLKSGIKYFFYVLLFVFLTLLTQIGGLVFLVSLLVVKTFKHSNFLYRLGLFLVLYILSTFAVVPAIAPIFGREKVRSNEKIKPANFMSVALNRNYVVPEMNALLYDIEKDLSGFNIVINTLDANFPFIDGFPLLPHLSHNDGRKLDLGFVYETADGHPSPLQISRSGYGRFEPPKKEEFNQIKKCLAQGYFQYSYAEYLTFGTPNENLKFSKNGTKLLADAILKQKQLQKLFIEPHLQQRLQLTNSKVRFHGCRAVRHDDHIHVQVD